MDAFSSPQGHADQRDAPEAILLPASVRGGLVGLDAPRRVLREDHVRNGVVKDHLRQGQAHHLTNTGACAHLDGDSPPGRVIGRPADGRQLGPIGITQRAAFLGVLALILDCRLLEGVGKVKLFLQDVLREDSAQFVEIAASRAGLPSPVRLVLNEGPDVLPANLPDGLIAHGRYEARNGAFDLLPAVFVVALLVRSQIHLQGILELVLLRLEQIEGSHFHRPQVGPWISLPIRLVTVVRVSLSGSLEGAEEGVKGRLILRGCMGRKTVL